MKYLKLVIFLQKVFNKPINITLVSVFFFLFSGTQTLAQEQTMIWSIRGNGAIGKSYLVATLPIQDSTFYAYPSKIWTYLNNSDVFLFSESSSGLYSEFEQHYGIIPNEYMKSFAENQLKPVIELKTDGFPFASQGQLTKEEQTNLKEAFLSGDFNTIHSIRLAKDIAGVQGSRLENVNYSLVSEIEQAIRLQPMFIVIDAAYVSGSSGLPVLLRSKGYDVRAEQEKFYRKNAEAIQAKNQLGSTPNDLPNQAQADTPSMQVEPYEGPLNLPMGIYNIDQWGDYELESGMLNYQAPSRLKQLDASSVFQTEANGLTYSIEVNNLGNLQQELAKLTIRTGGQLVNTTKMNVQGLRATEAEFMLAENRLAIYRIVEHPRGLVSFAVVGDTPQIFSIEASRFLESVSFFNSMPLENQNSGNQTSFPTENPYPSPGQNPGMQSGTLSQTNSWVAQTIMNYTLFLPRKPTEIKSETENGELISYVIPRGEVDKNVYVVSASKQEELDLFRLFNQSINEAATEVRGVVEERLVMTAERPNSAEYLVRDAVGNYYRIIYFTRGNTFYQFVVMGDKKSVKNKTTEQILNSIFRTN